MKRDMKRDIFIAFGLLALFVPVIAGFAAPAAAAGETLYAAAGDDDDGGVDARLAPAPGTSGSLPENFEEDVEELRTKAQAGEAESQFNLGYIYYRGWGVARDVKQAIFWFRRAAERGYAPAQNNLGFIYVQGFGVPQDYVLAHMWLNLAAGGGHEDAVGGRAAVAKLMTSEQISEAQRLARVYTARVLDPRAQQDAAAGRAESSEEEEEESGGGVFDALRGVIGGGN